MGVSLFPNHQRNILPESEFSLVDRLFEPGNLCKRSVDDMQSGIVATVDVKFKVQHAISEAHVDEWKTSDDLDWASDLSVGDYVAFNDWVGQVRFINLSLTLPADHRDHRYKRYTCILTLRGPYD